MYRMIVSVPASSTFRRRRAKSENRGGTKISLSLTAAGREEDQVNKCALRMLWTNEPGRLASTNAIWNASIFPNVRLELAPVAPPFGR